MSYDYRKYTKAGKAARRREYEAYLESPEWKAKRLLVYERESGKCARCEEQLNPGWHCHHRTYARFGAELLEDLEGLCKPCHESHHAPALVTKLERKRVRKAKKKQAKQVAARKKGHNGKKYLATQKQQPKQSKRAFRRRGIIAINEDLHARQVTAKRRREAA